MVNRRSDRNAGPSCGLLHVLEPSPNPARPDGYSLRTVWAGDQDWAASYRIFVLKATEWRRDETEVYRIMLLRATQDE